MKKLAGLMLDNMDDLAAIVTLEAGKPLAEARGEIQVIMSTWSVTISVTAEVYMRVACSMLSISSTSTLRNRSAIMGTLYQPPCPVDEC